MTECEDEKRNDFLGLNYSFLIQKCNEIKDGFNLEKFIQSFDDQTLIYFHYSFNKFEDDDGDDDDLMQFVIACDIANAFLNDVDITSYDLLEKWIDENYDTNKERMFHFFLLIKSEMNKRKICV